MIEMYKCPECGSKRINQYRCPWGPMWCGDCGYRIENKEKEPNPFVVCTQKSRIGANDEIQK